MTSQTPNIAFPISHGIYITIINYNTIVVSINIIIDSITITASNSINVNPLLILPS